MIERSKTLKHSNTLSRLILLFAVAIFGVVLFGNYIQYKNYDSIRHSWIAYQEIPEKKAFLLNTLLRHAGYSGFIHHFKNMVLRGDLSHAQEARNHHDAALRAIESYQQLDLDDKEARALTQIHETLLEYGEKLDFAILQLESNTMSTSQLDRAVKVDDTSATLGLQTLYDVLLKLNAEGEKLQEAYYREGQAYILSVVIFLTSLLIFGIIIFVFLKRLWRELAVQSHRVNSIIANTAEGVVTIDADGKIDLFNPSAEKLFGYVAKEVRGKDVSVLLPQEERTAHKGYVRKSGLAKSRVINQSRDLYGLKKDGELFPMELTVSVLPTASGREFVGIFHDITERIENQKRMEALALTDHLTGLANRNQFNTRVKESMALAKREEKKLTLMLIDLDHFKPVNDTHGHPVGDIVLQHVADIFRLHTRQSDIIARLGGDEFAIVLVNAESRDDTKVIAERIIQEINRPLTIEGQNIQIGASIGISIYPNQAHEQDDLIKLADQALYMAKHKGRNTVVFCTDTPVT